MVEKQGKVIVCNILIILTAVAAIVTLVIGSFWNIKLELTLNQDSAKKVMGEKYQEQIDNLGEFEIKLPIELKFQSLDMIQSVSGNAEGVTDKFVNTTVRDFLDGAFGQIDAIVSTVMRATVGQVVKKAKDSVSQQLGEAASQEEVAKKLKDDYGVTSEQIEAELDKVSAAALKILEEGDDTELKNLVETSIAIDALFAAYADGEVQEGATAEERAAKKDELKNNLLQKYDETVAEFKDENGKISTSSALVSILKMAGIKKADESEQEIESVDDLKDMLTEKVNTAVGENKSYIGWALKGMGIFLLVVIASWAYIIVKCIIKMFMRNKTVGMFFPRFFGWMPHVFLVGVPMLIVKYSAFFMEKFGSKMAEDTQNIVKSAQEIISLKLGSLTWVSALCTVILFVIWIPYYGWRRKIKRELRDGTSSYGDRKRK